MRRLDQCRDLSAFGQPEFVHALVGDGGDHELATRQFDDDSKAQAVRLVLDEGKSVGAVAHDLNLTESALR